MWCCAVWQGISGGQDGAIAPDGGGGTQDGTEAEHKEIGDGEEMKIKIKMSFAGDRR